MKVAFLSVTLLLIVLNSSWGLPPSRRYEYDNIEGGHRKPLGLNTRFAPRYGDVPRGLGEHTDWCPLRAREALRLPAPAAQRLPAVQRFPAPQRLPVASNFKGPHYFNNLPDENEAVRRYGRSQRTDSNVRQVNNFNDANNPDWDEDGVDVGGIFWPRRQIPKFDVEKPKPDCGCHHDKISALAKDATAAAANAATAAAVAARAAARAAAAAACGPDSSVEDHGNPSDDHGNPSEFISDDYQDTFLDEDNFQDHTVNSQDGDDNQDYSDNIEENSQGHDDFSHDTTKSEIDSLINTSSRTKRVMDFNDFPQGMNGGQEFSKDKKSKSETTSRVNSVMNSQGKKFKESTSNTEFSQDENANEVVPWKNSNGGLNYGLLYNSNTSQGTAGANVRRNGANTQSTPGKVIKSAGTTDSRVYPYSETSTVYSKGSNSDLNYSQGSNGSRVVTPQRSNTTWTNSKDETTVAGEGDLREEIKKNITLSGLSNVQSIAPHVVRLNS